MRDLLLAAVLAVFTIPCWAQPVPDAWKTDIENQPLEKRPRLEARYPDATRTAFDIDAENYRLLFDLKAERGQRLRSLLVGTQSGAAEVLAGEGAVLTIEDSNGTLYSSADCTEPSRVNIYRRGPYYIETHWLDVQLMDPEGNAAPVKSEVVFYSYPEKTHVSAILHVTGPMSVKSALMRFDFDAEGCASPAVVDSEETPRLNSFCLIRRAKGEPSCAIIYPVPRGVDDVTLEKTQQGIRVSNYIYNAEAHDGALAEWAEGAKAAAHFEVLPLESGEVNETLEAEARPLLSANISATAGRSLGYDPVRGCYTVRTDNKGNFSYHYYEDPNAYERASLEIRSDDLPRKIYVLHETGKYSGNVECGVVLDEQERTLPILVQIGKNFAGEKEEPFYNPKDTPFSETFFPLHLKPNEKRKLTSLHLYQNWGNHPLKQFSSLGAWMDYYHMSTGVTETTCYVPFLFGGLNGVNIADLRPMSQKMWESQPQHDNVAGHSFLRYRTSDGRWHYLEYVGTTFRSTGPNWADMSLDYISDDGKARVRLDVFELPQTDELRNFIHMRVDFLEDLEIENSDFGRHVRLLNIATWVQHMRYTHLAFGGSSGEPTIMQIKLNDGFTACGNPIPINGFAAVYPDKRGANAYIIRRFDGSIGGKPVSAGVSLEGLKNGDTTLMLVPVPQEKQIKAGDYLDIDLFIMPYGGGTQDWEPAQKAAYDYGVNAPRVTSITGGEKLSDFPTRIQLDENERAEFAVTGGFDYMPIIVQGAENYVPLNLYRIDPAGGQKTLIEHSQPDEIDGHQIFACADGTFEFVYLVKTDGEEHHYVVE